MRNFLSFLMVAFFLVGCGDHKSYLQNGDGYQLREDLNAVGRVTLSFQQVFLYRSISVGAAQSGRCKVIAADYSKSSAVQLNEASLKLSFEQPEKRCARRNVIKQCETYQFIYTFNCQFETK